MAAGILREKPEVLKRTVLVIITNSDMVSDEELEKLEKTVLVLSVQKSVITYYGGVLSRTFKKIRCVLFKCYRFCRRFWKFC
jgi:hypothetical protein